MFVESSFLHTKFCLVLKDALNSQNTSTHFIYFLTIVINSTCSYVFHFSNIHKCWCAFERLPSQKRAYRHVWLPLALCVWSLVQVRLCKDASVCLWKFQRMIFCPCRRGFVQENKSFKNETNNDSFHRRLLSTIQDLRIKWLQFRVKNGKLHYLSF